MQNLALNENKASVFNFQKIKNKKKKKKAAAILDKIFIEFFFALIHLFFKNIFYPNISFVSGFSTIPNLLIFKK